jgi:hypothetical protein
MSNKEFSVPSAITANGLQLYNLCILLSIQFYTMMPLVTLAPSIYVYVYNQYTPILVL